MGYTSEIVTEVAMHDIEVAFSGLVFLNHGYASGATIDEIMEWAHHLCSYTRYVHLNTWSDLEPINRVRNDFLPEFENAELLLDELILSKDDLGLDAEKTKSLKRYRKNINARKRNLKNRYCMGLDSAFSPDAEEPTLPD